jgi:transcriptional regulator with XRE-family HTH domain
MTFGERLRQLRLEKKVNQRDLASRVGIDFTYLSKLENGRMPPPATATIARLSTALGADNDELMLLASKVPLDVAPVITRSPVVPVFLRSIQDFNDEEISKLADYAQKVKAQRNGK